MVTARGRFLRAHLARTPCRRAVTGVSRYLGGRWPAAVGRPGDRPGHRRGHRPAPPRDLELLGRTEFIRADIRNPLIAKVIARPGSTPSCTPRAGRAAHAGGRMPMKELNVIGTMQLLAACQKSETVGAGGEVDDRGLRLQPARSGRVHRGHAAAARPRRGYAKDAVEVEGYVRGFARRRPDIDVDGAALRQLRRPEVGTTLTRYLALPVVPTALGLRPAPAGAARGRRGRGVAAAPLSIDRPGVVQRRRRRRGAAVPGHPPGRPRRLPVPAPAVALGQRAGAQQPGGRLLRGAGAVPQLRPGRRHHPAA